MKCIFISHKQLKEKSSANRSFRGFFCTQDRDRTGTPKNWCLRPARLPIPPPGQVCYLVVNWCANIIEKIFMIKVFFKFF